MKFASASAMLLLLLSCFFQLHNCASSFLFPPPQKYSVHLSRKELINELQGLSHKAGIIHSKWSNEAGQQTSNFSLKDLLSPWKQNEEEDVSSVRSVTSLKTNLEAPVGYSKFKPMASLLHRPTAAEISLGIFNVKNYIQTRKMEDKLREERYKAVEQSSTEDSKEDQEIGEPALSKPEGTSDEDSLEDKSRTDEIKPEPSVIRNCFFLRSGCVPVRRLDRARTSAYLDKVKALMTT